MLTCPACAEENEDGRRFCGGCGAPLPMICAAWGSRNASRVRYCGECGSALGAPPAEAPVAATASPPQAIQREEGERKQLTVLFADVQGSMDLQESLDPEVWAAIMGRFASILAEGVRRYGGTVDKFTGDGIMALFGAPVAQEDHARRACHAALTLIGSVAAYTDELRRSHGLELPVRVGLNSGEAVVGWVGEDHHLDPTAFGHAVGLAQRMEALAEPGHAYLTEHTARLVDSWFRLGDLGLMAVKGARDPMRVFVLEGPVAQLSGRRFGTALGIAHLVGRERELAALEDALARAAEGDAQVVGVVGEAGVGKSRLCEEFAQSVAARGITVRRTTGLSHGREVPLLPVLALLREYFGIADTDTPDGARQRISQQLLALDANLSDDLPLLFDFLEVPDRERPGPRLAAEVRMQRIFEALRRVTARRSEREVLVLVAEDLQWFDPQSTAFLERMVQSYPGSRTLVVTNFRPEFSSPWMHHSCYRQIALSPLSADSVAEMLAELLGDDASLAPLPAHLVERTGGNPFFVEEVVRALVEEESLEGRPGAYRLVRPVQKAALPARVQSVLAARIDRLSAEHKPVLQSASVIGRTFAETVLAHVTGQAVDRLADALSVLCAAELLQEAQRFPHAEYRFWHPLTQEVAYGSLLSERRKRLHAAVAEALIELDADRLDEEAAVVAWHWERAGRRVEAARWNLRAANFALRNDLDEALRRLRLTLDLLDGAEATTQESLELGVRTRMRLLQIGRRAGHSTEQLEQYRVEGMNMARRLGDPRLRMLMGGFSGASSYYRGHLQEGLAHIIGTAEFAEESDDPEARAVIGMTAALLRSSMGPLNEGLREAEATLRRCEGHADWGLSITGYRLQLRLLQHRAVHLARLGRLRDARAEVDRTVALIGDKPEPETLCMSLALLPLLELFAGSPGDTYASSADAVRVAEETGNVVSLVLALEALGLTYLGAEQYGQARIALERALAVGRERYCLFADSSILAHLAVTRLAAGHQAGAALAADEAVTVARRQGARVYECLALLTRARVGRAGQASPVAVHADLDAAMSLVRQTGALTYEPFIHEEFGRLRGDESELREALRLYEIIGATGHASRLEAQLTGSAVAHEAPQP